jgi:hypothetical protein
MHLLRCLAGICVVLFCLQAAIGPAEARRVALVIGNADYKAGPLANPVNDATAVAAALEKLGFDKVILKKDLGAEAFRDQPGLPPTWNRRVAAYGHPGHGKRHSGDGGQPRVPAEQPLALTVACPHGSSLMGAAFPGNPG